MANKEMTFGEWMTYFGYHWVEGHEQLIKGLMSQARAESFIMELESQGAIINAM